MAIYHLSAKILTRSAGHNAVAAASYRSGEELTDAKSQQAFDYSRRQRIGHTEIMTPEDAPGWMQNRESLWNGVEAQERRRDSQLARDFSLALPRELDAEQQKELLRGFVQQAFVNRGMVADLAMHETEGHNPHAHVMVTMRAIEGNSFGLKNTAWNKVEVLEGWRADWQEHVNAALESAGETARVDHRTLEAQGIDREPGVHLGKHATAMQRKNQWTPRTDRQADIDRDNAFRAGFMRLERADIAAELEERTLLERRRDRGLEHTDEWADWRDYAAQRDHEAWRKHPQHYDGPDAEISR